MAVKRCSTCNQDRAAGEFSERIKATCIKCVAKKKRQYTNRRVRKQDMRDRLTVENQDLMAKSKVQTVEIQRLRTVLAVMQGRANIGDQCLRQFPEQAFQSANMMYQLLASQTQRWPSPHLAIDLNHVNNPNDGAKRQKTMHPLAPPAEQLIVEPMQKLDAHAPPDAAVWIPASQMQPLNPALKLEEPQSAVAIPATEQQLPKPTQKLEEPQSAVWIPATQMRLLKPTQKPEEPRSIMWIPATEQLLPKPMQKPEEPQSIMWIPATEQLLPKPMQKLEEPRSAVWMPAIEQLLPKPTQKLEGATSAACIPADEQSVELNQKRELLEPIEGLEDPIIEADINAFFLNAF